MKYDYIFHVLQTNLFEVKELFSMKRFIDIHIPVTTCNLKCHYCYVTQEGVRNSEATPFNYSSEHIGKALSQERLGGICHFNMCGLGETLIPQETVDITYEILKQGHYIMIVTNGLLTNRLQQFTKFPDELKRRLGFKFSFHYLELQSRGLFDTFFQNVQLIKDNRMSFSIELTPSDELEPYIDDVKKTCMEHVGAYCHVTIPRDVNKKGIELLSRHNIEDFQNIWKTFNSELFDFKKSTWGVKRCEYCYAGAWSGLLNIGNGMLTACYGSNLVQNIFEDISKPIHFVAVGKNCKLPHCYNSHSLLALGDIPEIKGYSYAQERNRINLNDNTDWLLPQMKEFLAHRLENCNCKFTPIMKFKNSLMQVQVIFNNYAYKTESRITKVKKRLLHRGRI